MDKLKTISFAALMVFAGAALTTGAFAIGTATETHINILVERSPVVRVEDAQQEAVIALHPVPQRKPNVPYGGIRIK